MSMYAHLPISILIIDSGVCGGGCNCRQHCDVEPQASSCECWQRDDGATTTLRTPSFLVRSRNLGLPLLLHRLSHRHPLSFIWSASAPQMNTIFPSFSRNYCISPWFPARKTSEKNRRSSWFLRLSSSQFHGFSKLF
ncbi:hypothetical protein B0H19DRAFT_101227 [Mycena capillaripes]|nr:hypothetical protein B0H19DRAFT_101227 [Mycena capillaripes]